MLVKGKSIAIEYITKEKYRLVEALKEDRICNFGVEINFYNTTIIVDLNFQYSGGTKEYPKTIVRFKDLKGLTQTYQNKIVITQKDKESTVINLSILEEDPFKGVVFLNKLTACSFATLNLIIF